MLMFIVLPKGIDWFFVSMLSLTNDFYTFFIDYIILFFIFVSPLTQKKALY